MAILLRENLTFAQANLTLEDKDGKDLYLKGICIEGEKKNANGRIYGVDQIRKAVHQINEQIKGGYSVLGEVDHPNDLKINLDRVCHMVTDMWMDGATGYGKLKILPTPMGNLITVMLKSDVRVGVSSRGSGNVNEANGQVSDFEIVTIDIVAQPSAPNAYPTPVYEGLLNMRHGYKVLEAAGEVGNSKAAQKYIEQSIVRLIRELKL